MSAARPSALARSKAPAIRAVPAARLSAVELIELRRDLGHVLVAAAAEAQEIKARRLLRFAPGADGVLVGLAVGEEPRDRVRRLESRDDPLQTGELAEPAHGVGVGHGHISGAPRVAQISVLRPDPGIVEAGRD